MNHEPECPAHWGVGEMPEPCAICPIIRAAYKRGMLMAAEIAQERCDDLEACHKIDDCHILAKGAFLAADDIRWAVERKEVQA